MRPALLLIALAAVSSAACSSRGPCAGYQFDRMMRYSRPYAGAWQVTRGDTLTFPDAPQMGDKFRLVRITLDTIPDVVAAGGGRGQRVCLLHGQIIFSLPRAETLAVNWFGQPEQAIVSGWPADLGPFAGVALADAGRDSLRGSILFDAKLGVQARPGMTAQFMAGRLSSQP
jgi:hypothetical protein